MNIYISNLADEVNEQDLRDVFEVFGQVEFVNILKDRFSDKSRGFGFLVMLSEDNAHKAIKEANGTDLRGTAIRVNEAYPRPSGSLRRGGSTGGGRGGGRGGRRSY